MAFSPETYVLAVKNATKVSKYKVTIALTNPVNSASFHGVDIYEGLSADPYDVGKNIDSIIISTGTKTVELSPKFYGVVVLLKGTSVSVDSGNITCTGGVVLKNNYGDAISFEVTGDGTATLDSVDYND